MEIKKDGYMKYISHLDMMKLFKNAFKIAGIRLDYSQGFNPHPKMGFAQPLPLGYSSLCELLEFETKEYMEPAVINDKIGGVVPKGIKPLGCRRTDGGKSLSARTYAAAYEITIPVSSDFDVKNDAGLCADFLKREKITVIKKQKKTGRQAETDIRCKIRELSVAKQEFRPDANATVSEVSQSDLSGVHMETPVIVLKAKLDCGSDSNLSPELLISAFCSFAGISAAREEIDVRRTEIFFTV